MSEQRLSKEEFKEKMKSRRMEIFKTANSQLEKIMNDPSLYLQYLKMQSTFGYTISNTLLIMHSNPNATFLKDYSRWKELNAFPKKNEKGIAILEPSHEYIKPNGSKGVNYNIKYVFDVSQTTYDGELPHNNYPNLDKLYKALSHKSDIPVITIEGHTSYPRQVYYEPYSRQIMIQKNISNENLILGLMREYAVIEINKPESYIKESSFAIYSVTYMLATKYGLEYKDTSFATQCSEFFKNKSLKIAKKNLEDMKRVFDEISKRIDYGLYAQEYYERQESKN